MDQSYSGNNKQRCSEVLSNDENLLDFGPTENAFQHSMLIDQGIRDGCVTIIHPQHSSFLENKETHFDQTINEAKPFSPYKYIPLPPNSQINNLKEHSIYAPSAQKDQVNILDASRLLEQNQNMRNQIQSFTQIQRNYCQSPFIKNGSNKKWFQIGQFQNHQNKLSNQEDIRENAQERVNASRRKVYQYSHYIQSPKESEQKLLKSIFKITNHIAQDIPSAKGLQKEKQLNAYMEGNNISQNSHFRNNALLLSLYPCRKEQSWCENNCENNIIPMIQEVIQVSVKDKEAPIGLNNKNEQIEMDIDSLIKQHSSFIPQENKIAPAQLYQHHQNLNVNEQSNIFEELINANKCKRQDEKNIEFNKYNPENDLASSNKINYFSSNPQFEQNYINNQLNLLKNEHHTSIEQPYQEQIQQGHSKNAYIDLLAGIDTNLENQPLYIIEQQTLIDQSQVLLQNKLQNVEKDRQIQEQFHELPGYLHFSTEIIYVNNPNQQMNISSQQTDKLNQNSINNNDIEDNNHEKDVREIDYNQYLIAHQQDNKIINLQQTGNEFHIVPSNHPNLATIFKSQHENIEVQSMLKLSNSYEQAFPQIVQQAQSIPLQITYQANNQMISQCQIQKKANNVVQISSIMQENVPPSISLPPFINIQRSEHFISYPQSNWVHQQRMSESPCINITINKNNEINLSIYTPQKPAWNESIYEKEKIDKKLNQIIISDSDNISQGVDKLFVNRSIQYQKINMNSSKQISESREESIHEAIEEQSPEQIQKRVHAVADRYLSSCDINQKDHKQFESILIPYIILKFTPQPKNQAGKMILSNGLILIGIVKLVSRSNPTPFLANFIYQYMRNSLTVTSFQYLFKYQSDRATEVYQTSLQKQFSEFYNKKIHQEKQNVIKRRTMDQQHPFTSLKCEKTDSFQQTNQKLLRITPRSVHYNEKVVSIVRPTKEEGTGNISKMSNQEIVQKIKDAHKNIQMLKSKEKEAQQKSKQEMMIKVTEKALKQDEKRRMQQQLQLQLESERKRKLQLENEEKKQKARFKIPYQSEQQKVNHVNVFQLHEKYKKLKLTEKNQEKAMPQQSILKNNKQPEDSDIKKIKVNNHEEKYEYKATIEDEKDRKSKKQVQFAQIDQYYEETKNVKEAERSENNEDDQKKKGKKNRPKTKSKREKSNPIDESEEYQQTKEEKRSRRRTET